MGWVPYPAHMGPRFAGPITALRAFKKKKVKYACGGTSTEQMEVNQTSLRNLGQKLPGLGQYVRLNVGSHPPYAHVPLPTK